MKKTLLIVLSAVLAFQLSAQNLNPIKSRSVATNTFWANWFISAGGQYNAAYTSQEVSEVKFNPFRPTRGEFGFHVAIGKWFTPSIGLRTQWEGLWNKNVVNPNFPPSYTYFNLHEDLLLNLSNLFCGYNPRRVWNFIPWAGIGFMRNMTYNINEMSYNMGLTNQFRLTDRLYAYFDLHVTAVRGRFDAARHALPDAWESHKTGALRHWDKQLGIAVGLTFQLGKNRWDAVPDVEAITAMNEEQIEALNATIAELQEELDNRQANPAESEGTPAPAEVRTDTVWMAPPLSVFFELGEARLERGKDLVALKELADFANQHHATLVVTGYADSQTGDASLNLQLSQQRAAAVADELEKMGIDRSRIVSIAAGGVDTLSPFFYNRRATVQLK